MLSPQQVRNAPAEDSFTTSSTSITPERRKMNREVSYYGPLFPTTPAPGAKEDEERTPLLAQLPSPEVLAHTQVYPLIHLIRVDVTTHIDRDALPDTPLTVDQLHAPDSTYTIVSLLPAAEQGTILERFLAAVDQHIVRLKSESMRDVSSQSGWSERTLPLASLLLTPWALFQGASEVVMAKIIEEDGDDDALVDLAGNALEVSS
ncbi:hypothetical protein QFC22_002972 [Naganishia vaughanmartiniae]|uniref:Uncharacterized protein n=1 Tax=Naganishia vaughanmartiniae TaxID=1424756 RepID=A0ACC2X9P8_9TREE|nr:hypothetical protein QFC22_002972 [Naganishia vaughanmartiniae]